MNTTGRKSPEYRGSRCLNCGQALARTDVYCPRCSQLNSNKPLSAKDFFGEFLSSILVYDSRVWTTLRDLTFRPGVITKNYVKGQRLKYANPFRFFLSVSIMYFLLRGALSFMGIESANKAWDNDLVNNELVSEADSVAAAPVYSPRPRLPLDTVRARQLGIGVYVHEKDLDSLSWFGDIKERYGLFASYYVNHRDETAEHALEQLNYRQSFKNKWLYSRILSMNRIEKNPGVFLDFITAKAPFLFFFFAPFFALAFWALYSRRRFNYMEHLIFVFQVFGFVFLAMLLYLVPAALLDTGIFSMLFFWVVGPVYFYLALFNFYGQGALKTLFKFSVLSFVFTIGLFLASLLFVVLGAAVF